MIVEATAPTRIDLAGGTLDIWPLYLFHPGALTVNLAIDRRAFCRVETGVRGVRLESLDTGRSVEGRDVGEVLSAGELPLPAFLLRAMGVETGVRLVLRSSVPAGSGLGGSSALAVAAAAALGRAIGRELDAEALLRLVRDAEAQCIGVPTGVQDYLAALHGGVLAVRLEPGGTRVERLAVPAAWVEEHLLLVDAGATRFSGINNWEVFKARIDGDARVREALDEIVSVAAGLRAALLSGQAGELAALLPREWEARKRLAPAVTTPDVDRIVALAVEAGGAAKVCGAGGGGMVAVWDGGGRREALARALAGAGFARVPFRVADAGLALTSL
jgi:D-glycero-alpha-D-manno-heptose-7-phosphate kinase